MLEQRNPMADTFFGFDPSLAVSIRFEKVIVSKLRNSLPNALYLHVCAIFCYPGESSRLALFIVVQKQAKNSEKQPRP